MVEEGTVLRVPLLESTPVTVALTDDARWAEDVVEEVDQLVHNRVVHGGVKAQAMRAGNEVSAVGPYGGGPPHARARKAVHVAHVRRDDEEVEAKSGDVVGGVQEGEAA